VINRLTAEFGGKDLRELTSEEILSFLTRMTEGSKQQTKRTRFSHLSAFFSFIRQHIDPQAQNPCDTPMIKKLFNHGNLVRWNTFDKETVDEIIFKASNLRNRIILELMARGGMRVGEVLKLTPNDIHEKKLTLRAPKSGKEREYVFIPQKVADRLKDYVREKSLSRYLVPGPSFSTLRHIS
jgi:integrase/recombinase XerD